MERGLLDISVVVSNRNLTAGNEFAVFVLVKNPFEQPIWIREVHVSLPSELSLTSRQIIQERRKVSERKQKLKQLQKERVFKMRHKLSLLKQGLIKIKNKLSNQLENTQNDQRLIERIKFKINELQNKLAKIQHNSEISSGTFSIVNLDTLGFQIISQETEGSSEEENKKQHIDINDFTIYPFESAAKHYLKTRRIELESSLPPNTALQPGSTVVYTATLNIEKSLIFTPTIYRLQFNVNYSLYLPKNLIPENEGNKGIFANTVAYEISIRPSVCSVITGSILGGSIGAIARFLQMASITTWKEFTYLNIFSIFVGVVVSVILSGMAAIFMVRKSNAPSFVSVEDFWGGLLIGFLVGYTGASFFQELTGIKLTRI